MSSKMQFDPEGFVGACYQAILRRQPDPSGLASHASRLVSGNDTLANVLSSILSSDESVRVNAARLALARTGNGAPAALVSLGTACFTSTLLKRLDLKSWSGPLDWVFSSIPMTTHCVEDDFNTFLDRRYYVPVPLAERKHGPTVNRVQHEFYRKHFGVDFVFNHHDVHLVDDYAYLRRCVERLRQQLDSGEYTTFVMHRHFSPEAVAQLTRLDQVLRARSGKHRLIAILVSDGERFVPRVEVIATPGDTLRVFHYHATSAWRDLYFEESSDEIMVGRLIKMYMLRRDGSSLA